MIDWHTHQGLNAVAEHRLHMESARSAKEALEMVAEALEDPRYDPKIELNFVGINMRNAEWTDAHLMTRQSLDKISADRPIFLLFNGYHSMCINTAGMKRTGTSIEQFPDGLLYEKDAFKISHDLSNLGDEVLDKWIAEEAQYAASLGVTEIVDLEMTHNIPAWQRRCAKGFDTLRVHIGFYDAHLDDAIELGLKTGDPVPGCDGLVITGPYKVVTDGSLGSQTAYCHDPYPNSTNHGVLAYPPRTLAEVIERGCKNGFRMAIHAIGDEANHLALKTISEAPKLLPGSTIEHAQLLDFDDLPLFASLGLIASIQPCHLVDDRALCHKFWPGREGRAYAFKSIVDAGIPIKLGSDTPVAPLQPWEAIAVAITRAGEHEDSPFCGEQIIDLETAFAASTCVRPPL